MSVDLHLHSCFSDGTYTPEEMAEALKQHGITLAALADHNTCDGYPRFHAACDSLGISTIRGMEMDCLHDGIVIHVLAYGFEAAGKILSFAAHSRQLLLEMSRDLVRRMHKDYPQLSLEEYDSFTYDSTKGGWKGLHYLLEKGIVQNLCEGRKLYSKYHCDYSDYPFPSAGAVCQAIRDAGGLPVLAHPGNWFAETPPKELTEKFDALRTAGLGGIECYYPSHSPRLTAFCLAYCSKHNLLVTAGSDCHGEFLKTIGGVDYVLGAVNVTADQLRLGRLMPKTIS
ncbi:MAG: PHP domain-containing protein [Angelakisella sp.]